MAKKNKTPKHDVLFAMHEDATLKDELERRYLMYALSVITSRALPDVRDGLKPVQRRILYTMWNNMRLRHDAKPRKSAAIVGDVMGKYHPHGDGSIYDALVRMAQSFTMRVPLVDGRGNFGNADGDGAAAMRYTEARLQKAAEELLAELGKKTVDFRPNYDGTHFEPTVLPARYPNLLVNGVQGIAVGMATSIPPHNLGEVVKAAIRLIDDPELSVKALLRTVKGPDFPTGGVVVSSKEDVAAVYETGRGTLKLRGEWKLEESDNKRDNPLLVITSIPYDVKRANVTAGIGELVAAKKLPSVLDVRDESTEDTRVVCEIAKGADPQMIMAYLFKHTPLQTTVSVDMTALVPVPGSEVPTPKRLDLKEMLQAFLTFRMEVVTKRLQFDLSEIEARLHLLAALQSVFDALDETIQIIRKSNDKPDAAARLMKRFGFDEVQVDAILELRLHRLAKLQILVIREEIAAKEKEAKALRALLKKTSLRWDLIKDELTQIDREFGSPRRTEIAKELDEVEFDAEAFIALEDAMVVLTQQGWLKRQKVVRDVSATRVRDGDSVLEVVAGSTRSAVALFGSTGTCYVTRIVDIPATTGYGSPVQSMFKMADGEKIVAMVGMDARFLEVPAPVEGATDGPYCLAVTRGGLALQFSLRNHREASTRTGRKYARPPAGDEVIFVGVVYEDDVVACVTAERRALLCSAEEVSLLSGAGKGVTLIKLAQGDSVVGAALLHEQDDALVVQKDGGAELRITRRKYDLVSRGGKGFELFKRGVIAGLIQQMPTLPGFPLEGEN